MKTDHCIVVCDRFAREAKTVAAELDGVRVVVFPARCEPPYLGWAELSAACGRQCAGGVDLFGCTCLAGLGQPAAGGVRIHRFEQCFYLMVGRDLIDAYLRDGAHLYTPGWLTDWRRHLDELGFERSLAREFFAESTSRLVLLDTGVDPAARDRLRELAAWVGRPFEIVPVGLDHFRLLLSQRILETTVEQTGSRADLELAAARRQASDYAMAMDLVEGLAQSRREDQVVDGMLELFTTLFAPAELHFLPWKDGRMGALRRVCGFTDSRPEPEADPAAIRNRLAGFGGDHSFSPSGHGFVVRLAVRGETVGLLELNGLAFPAHLKHYLNLALHVAPVCALAIHNARAFEQITAAEAARRRSEERIAASLQEKEILLREIHHRVKNNMQVITSLLRLQGRKLREPEVLAALQESEHRIRAMALVHEMLYQSGYLARVSCQEYLRKLVRGLTRAYGSGRAARVVVDAADVVLAVDQAVAVGLIINELVTNALKHAFPTGHRGEIRVAMHPAGDGEIDLVVGDDGVGLAPGIDPESTATLGLRLVRRLAEDQLGGRLEIRLDGGTRFAIRFQLQTPRERSGEVDADWDADAIAADGAER